MHLKHDCPIRISVGRSRKETAWKPEAMSYSDLVQRVSTTRRTSETYEEFCKLPKAQQDGIKDVGGFVGGSLNGGRRKGNAVRDRWVITLDADYAPPSFWSDLKLLQIFATCCYSTHKHRPDRPRLRLVIPLSRAVTPDESQAIGRRIAEGYGIDCFDDTTFEPERLMYWPSTSCDGEFFFDYVDAPILDPDTILATYADWRNTAEWPESSRAIKIRQTSVEKQADPTTKVGVIGAVCRAYTVHTARDAFLPEVYAPTSDPNRYTFVGGSTTGGLVVYDNGKFAYSHHGTDPAAGRLLNAFDLVRIHRFGGLDKDAAPDTPVNRLPSHQAMLELAGQDDRVKIALLEKGQAEAGAEFREPAGEGAAKATDFMRTLAFDSKGRVVPSRDNLQKILENDPALAGAFGFNLFLLRPTILRPLPWNQQVDTAWQDADDAALRCHIETTYGINARDKLDDVLVTVMMKHAFHPVRSYLDAQKWDGVPRLDRLFIDVMGAPDEEYTRAVTRKWFTAAIARVRNPGCKFDYMPVLKGAQGVGKSRILSLLGHQSKGWFSDTPIPFDNPKIATETTAGKLVIELGEMSGLRKAEVESVNRFITSQGDTVRKAFGRYPGNYPRQCVFAGTTNRDDYINDPTGGRRFWPLDVDPTKAIYHREAYLTPATIDQLWAEADVRYKAGEKLWLPDELEAIALERQRGHTLLDERGSQVREYLDRLLPADWYRRGIQDRIIWLSNDTEPTDSKGVLRRDKVCAMEIWVECFNRRASEMDRRQSQQITDIMLQMKDWYKGQDPTRLPGYGLTRVFLRTGVTKSL